MSKSDLRFIDLFAGIGGIRIAFEQSGSRCVASCEWDRFARTTYSHYFSEDAHPFYEDIRSIDPLELPAFDILTGGFPCQPFSIAGVSKKQSMGRAHGFEDETQGTLFFNVAQILETAQPKAFLLENVKNLVSHDRGNTWRVIQAKLQRLGYVITHRILDAREVLPQHRQRIFIVGYHQSFCNLTPNRDYDWTPFWEEVAQSLDTQRQRCAQRFAGPFWPNVGSILEPIDAVSGRYVLSDKMWAYLQAYKRKHQKQGNGFGYGLVDQDSPYTRTISARYFKDGSEALVSRGKGENPRRLTPLECARLQGFPESFEQMFSDPSLQPVSDTQAYKQFGNSVCVPVVRAIAETLIRYLEQPAVFQNILAAPETPRQMSLLAPP